jgi:hypothetical protein
MSKSGRSLASSFELVLSSKSREFHKNPKKSTQLFPSNHIVITSPIKPLVNGYSPLVTKSSAS